MSPLGQLMTSELEVERPLSLLPPPQADILLPAKRLTVSYAPHVSHSCGAVHSSKADVAIAQATRQLCYAGRCPTPMLEPSATIFEFLDIMKDAPIAPGLCPLQRRLVAAAFEILPREVRDRLELEGHALGRGRRHCACCGWRIRAAPPARPPSGSAGRQHSYTDGVSSGLRKSVPRSTHLVGPDRSPTERWMAVRGRSPRTGEQAREDAPRP